MLSNDALLLNTAIATDPTQLNMENVHVTQIMSKLDLTGTFVRMIYRISSNISKSKTWTKATTEVKPQPIFSSAYHNMVQNTQLAAILTQIMGITVQPVNTTANSIIQLTGLSELDN